MWPETPGGNEIGNVRSFFFPGFLFVTEMLEIFLIFFEVPQKYPQKGGGSNVE